MSALLDSALDRQRLAECLAGDEADRLADEDLRIAQARRDAQFRPPYWSFAALEPRQARNSHPAGGPDRSIFRRPEGQ